MQARIMEACDYDDKDLYAKFNMSRHDKTVTLSWNCIGGFINTYHSYDTIVVHLPEEYRKNISEYTLEFPICVFWEQNKFGKLKIYNGELYFILNGNNYFSDKKYFSISGGSVSWILD
jgi:hypothetical protein